jgi:PAS domain S-box-containing protein
MTNEKLTYQELLEKVNRLENEHDERFRNIFNHSIDGIRIVDSNGIIIEENPSLSRITGIPTEQVIGKFVWDIVYRLTPYERQTPENYRIIKELSEKFIKAGVFPNENNFTEHRLQCLDGTIKIVESAFFSVKVESGFLLYSIIRDVTEIKQSQKAIIKAKVDTEESEQKYRLIAENTSDGILVIGADTKIQYVSPAYLKQIGYTEQEELSRNSETIYSIIHPEDRDTLFSNIFGAIENKKDELIYRYRVKHKRGHYIWREDNAKFNYDGEKNYINAYVICRDITEQKNAEQNILLAKEKAEESEQKYKQIFDNTFDIMSIYEVTEDHRFKVITFNPAEAKLIGPVEYYQNRYIDECISPELYNQFKQNYEKCIKEEKLIVYEENISFLQINKTFHTQLIPLKNIAGRIHRIIVISRDITENKLLNSQLKDQNEKLQLLNIDLTISKEKAEESDQLKTAFLQNMSHEVRTPLNAISGFSQLLANENQPVAKIKKFSDVINSSCNKLIEIISDVIEISQIQANLIFVKKSDFNFIQVITETIQEYKSKVDNKALEFIVKSNITSKEYYISSDKLKISKIFKQLIDNALKFTEKGQIIIELNLQSDKIEFVVIDTGIGISKEMQQKIFEPFRQVELGICRNYGGNGLGLAIVKAYTEMLNGTINLESEPNIGTSISISIPATQILPQDVSNKNSQNQKYSLNTILIVEDEPSNYEYLAELLSETKAKILHASNGQKAIDICRNETLIDFVLMDIKMPIMDGHTATKLIKMFRPDLPIIAQTAYALDNDKEKFLENGFDDYVSKPIQAATLFTTIDKYINR